MVMMPESLADWAGEKPPSKMCSACEKESDAAKCCNGWRCVWYCDKKCQNKHWKEHKKECRRIKKELDKRGGKLDLGTEEDVGPLGKLPPRIHCRFMKRSTRAIHAVARLSAAVAIFSTS